MDLSAIVSHNPILTGGAALGVAGSIFASLKNLPLRLASSIKRKIIYSLEVENSLQQHLKDTALPKSVGNHNFLTATLDTRKKTKIEVGKRKTEYYISYMFAPGEHLVWLNKVPVWITRTKKEKENSQEFTERLYLSTFVFCKKQLNEYFDKEVIESFNEEREDHCIYIWSPRDGWRLHQRIAKRKLSSIVIDEAAKSALVNDLGKFLDSEDWYLDRGIPYHRGYLLYGPPGNGKSSLIQTIAGHFNYDIYILNLAASDMDDSRLLNLLSEIKSGVVLIEDVDAQFVGRNNTNTDNSKSKLTFSGLLNALDGVGAKHGRVTFVTTNHIEKIDEALLRPGRLDYKIYLDNASEWQATEFFRRFFPESKYAEEFGRLGKNMNMATLQNHLLMNRYNDIQAIESFVTVSKEKMEHFFEGLKEPIPLENAGLEIPAA